MKKQKLIFPIAAIFLMLSFATQAQEYKSAVGARLGYPLSASFKYFLNDSHALEAYVGTRGWSGYRWTNISAAYLIHKPLDVEGVEGLSWYFGAGASVFFWNFDVFLGENYSTTTIGAQGYLGLDFAFPNAPVNLTVDWVPTYFFNGYGSGFGGGYGSLGVRYILSR
ncbi:MAG: hypothetical protein H6557_03535 [Lewinellaceae bacterium]|nr:hypothetical protein [Phaeodactylibacter sp.]MCB9035669.1 hypothetical protein [Lewinellaceae bacterium]